MNIRLSFSPAFALPTVMIASVVMLMVLLSGLTATSSSSVNLRNLYTSKLVESAAEAGVAKAKACLATSSNSITWSNASPLKPNTDCMGVETTACPSGTTTVSCYVAYEGNHRSTFSVGTSIDSGSGSTLIDSKGTVREVRKTSGAVIKSSTSVIKMKVSNNAAVTQDDFENPSSDWTQTYDIHYSDCCQSSTIGSSNFSCALAESNAFCWGSNNAGQLGDGTTTYRGSPVAVGGGLAGKTVSSIKTMAALSGSSDQSRACAIADQQLYCWGYGIGSTPQQITGAIGTRAVSSVQMSADHMYETEGTSYIEYNAYSASHYCAVAEGSLYCWGSNVAGQLGDGSTTARANPVAVGGALAGKTVSSVRVLAAVSASTDLSKTCAVADNQLYCWGYGIGSTPQQITGAIGTAAVSKVSMSYDAYFDRTVTSSYTNTDSYAAGHNCVISTGRVYCWGSNGAGQLGDGTTTSRSSPVLAGGSLTGLTATSVFTVAAVERSYDYSTTCAIANAQLHCWGAYQQTPQLVGGALAGKQIRGFSRTNAKIYEYYQNSSSGSSVSGRVNHSCAVANDGLYCWGSNGSGQLGNGTANAASQPVKVEGALSGKSVSTVTTLATLNGNSDVSTTCAVASDQLYCWGYLNGYTPQQITGAIGTSKLNSSPLLTNPFLVF